LNAFVLIIVITRASKFVSLCGSGGETVTDDDDDDNNNDVSNDRFLHFGSGEDGAPGKHVSHYDQRIDLYVGFDFVVRTRLGEY